MADVPDLGLSAWMRAWAQIAKGRKGPMPYSKFIEERYRDDREASRVGGQDGVISCLPSADLSKFAGRCHECCHGQFLRDLISTKYLYLQHYFK
jgi:hypothetical protein